MILGLSVGTVDSREKAAKIHSVTQANNFITDLWDEAIRQNASDVIIHPDSQPGMFVHGNLLRSGPVMDTNEIIEDLTALGFSKDNDQRFVYSTENGFMHHFRMTIRYDDEGRLDILFRYFESTVTKGSQP